MCCVSHAFNKALAYRTKLLVYFAGRATENELANSISCTLNVVEAAKNVDLGVSNDDTRPRRILDSKLSLSFLTADTANTTTQMVAMQGLHVLDLESLQVQVIETKNGNRVLKIESQHEALEEISAFLNRANILRRTRGLLHQKI